jgi:hypothetical protein
MSRSGDDYYRQVQRDQAYRDQANRDQWNRDRSYRDAQRRADDARREREAARWRREEAARAAKDAARKGNTAEAIRLRAGPDAAVKYLEATQPIRSSSKPARPARPEETPQDHLEPAWPQHRLVTTLRELIDNVEQAPETVVSDVVKVGAGRKLVVRGVDAERTEIFRVGGPLLLKLSPKLDCPSRTHRLVLALVARLDRKRLKHRASSAGTA